MLVKYFGKENIFSCLQSWKVFHSYWWTSYDTPTEDHAFYSWVIDVITCGYQTLIQWISMETKLCPQSGNVCQTDWDVKKDFKLSIIKCLQVFNNGIGMMHVVFYFIDYRYMKEEEVYVVAPKFKMLNALHTGLFICVFIFLTLIPVIV